MRKIQGLLRSILILCLFLSVKIEKAEAFGFLPPMPPEPVVDLPDEAGKIVSVAQASYQKLYAIDSKLATLRLDAIKKGDLFAIKEALSVTKALNEGGKKKSPNKSAAKASSVLKIEESNKGMLDEEAYFNAYNTLFFTYPSLEDYDAMFPVENGNRKADYAFMQTIYKQKAAQYRQDILIDTYLTARVMEDYLVTVERTINRLDKCQKEPDPEKCTFFGMTMAKVESKDEAPKGGEDDSNPGQIGAATNAYIVTMVYDRLMRLVEDLTATEALYQAAKQTEIADPVQPKGTDKNSSAADYIPIKYQFAYKEKREHTYAKQLINDKGFERSQCIPGEDGCPVKNEEGKAKKLMDDTKILTKLQPLDNILTEAITIHNIKNQLPFYKVQYRRYLRAIENHKRALQAVYDSDQCIVNFFMRHNASYVVDPITKEKRKLTKEEWEEYWGTAKGFGQQPTEDGHVFDYEKDYNDYEKRGGMSLDLIREYQKLTQNTVLGTSSECEGYYPEGQCADGYKSDTDQPCSADKSLFPCVIENAVEFDIGLEGSIAPDDKGETNISASLDKGIDQLEVKGLSQDEKDYVSSNSDIENIAKDNRVRTETPWRLGSQKIIEMMGREDHKILFEAWNDQKNLQVEYLRQKYHNITNIIKTTDKGWASYKIAQSLSENPDVEENEEELQNTIKTLIEGGQTCKSVGDATKDAAKRDCSSYSKVSDTHYRKRVRTVDEDGDEITVTLNCDASGNSHTGIITVTRETLGYDGRTVNSYTSTYNQYVSKAGPKCEFTKGASAFNITPATGLNCGDIWDFTKGFLIKRYLRCIISPNSDEFYKKAKGKGRIVARNKLQEVLNQRIMSENTVRAIVEDYNNKIDARQKELARKKEIMTAFNKSVDTATKDKNLINKLKDKSEERIKSIEDEIKSINEREAKVNIQSDKCVLDYRKANLNHEKSCIQNGTGSFSCPETCAGIKTSFQPEGCKDATKIPTCYDQDKGYTIALAEAMTAQKEFDRINTINNKKASNEKKEIIPDDIKKAMSKYIRPEDAVREIKAKDMEINSAQINKKTMQEEIAKLQEIIDDIADKFMSEEGKKWEEVAGDKERIGAVWVTKEQASYIVTSQDEQYKIEDENSEFESFLNREDDNRMTSTNAGKCCPCSKVFGQCLCHRVTCPIGSDNLETTLNVFFNNGAKQNTIYNNMKEKWINKVINQFGNNKFTIDGSFTLLELPAGEFTLKEAMKKVADVIAKAAAEQVVSNIKKGDVIITTEMNESIEDIKKLTDKYGISEIDQIPTEEQKSEIANHSNYEDWDGSNLKVSKDHRALIEQLRKPNATYENRINAAGIEMSALYGIPEGIENTWGSNENNPKDKYFVALPARGYNKAADFATDNFAGKDFMQPNGALRNLPPVREVFYFDAQDYEDLPREDDNRPSIPHLLDKKFPNHPDGFVQKWEYMPEVWRYLLARPNKRNDGMYQQTFVERNYDSGKLQELTEGAPGSGINPNEYGKIIAREGVYPCKLGNTNIDIKAGNSVDSIGFIHGNSSLAIHECKEIALNQQKDLKGVISKENICYLYNKNKGKSYHICHLLADHGGDEPKDIDNANASGKMGSYRNYSELGQFLQAGENIFYRNMQTDIAKYLSNKDNDKNDFENDIHRQMAELSSFKRNILGSFLDTVYTEHSAKKTRDNMRKTVLGNLTGLCKQIHQNGKSVSSALKDEGYKDADEKTRNAMDEACAKYLTDGEGKVSGGYAVGLAFSRIGEKDTKYGVNDEFTKDQKLYGGIQCNGGTKSSYYEDIFCKLDNIKAEKLAEAKRLLKEAEDIYQKMANEEGDKQYVLDRLTDIKDYITMLETDENEVVLLTPGMKKGTHEEKLDTIQVDTTKSYIEAEVLKAKANRTVERTTDEESLTGMDNGMQAVPYCPNY